MEKFIKYFIEKRYYFLAGIIIATAIWGVYLSRVRIDSSFADLLPQKHPYIKVHNEFSEKFGGANLVVIAVTVKEGEIYNYNTLKKIERITEVVDMMKGVDHYQVVSITHRKAKYIRVTSDFVGTRSLMYPVIPSKENDLQTIKRNVILSPLIYGQIVSADHKSVLIAAEFFEGKIDYLEAFKVFRNIIKKESDKNHSVYIAGSPMLIGWIYFYLLELYKIFIITILVMFALLYFYFRTWQGMLVPVLSAIFSMTWGLGFAGLLGYNLDPLILVIPFLISARAISHSVQFMERFYEEYEIYKDKKISAYYSSISLFSPGFLGIITDALGILLIALATIPLMQKLAYFCSFWAISIIFSVLFFNPIILSILPTPKKKYSSGNSNLIDKFLKMGGQLCVGKNRFTITAIALSLFIFAVHYSSKLTIGDVNVGSAILWPRSDYNISLEHIGEKFQGANPLYIIVSGKEDFSLTEPKVVAKVEQFQRHLEKNTNTISTITYVDIITGFQEAMREGDPKWNFIPSGRREISAFLSSIFNQSQPGDFERFITPDYKEAVIRAFYPDYTAKTILQTITESKKFIKENKIKEVEFKLAGGMIGVLAAINEEVAYSHNVNLFAIFLTIFLLSVLAFRSFLLGLLIIAPLALSNVLVFAFMYFKGIGLNINTLPVSSVGIGIGVDYAIYILSRIKEEYYVLGDHRLAVKKAISTTGKAVTFTALTLVTGVIFWYFSNLKFQAEMGILLALLMLINMFGAIFLLPSLVMLIKPKFASKKEK